MREIIYIQAGDVSNHIGTHFWNAQESYFTYDKETEAVVDHDISFRQGLSSQNEPTFCPRVLLFDHRSRFGSLSKYNDLYSDAPDADRPLSSGALWNGPVSEYRQDLIPKSEYQQRLEKGEDEEENEQDSTKPDAPRFWSDYNRVFYIPRSIQQVPDLPDWEANKGDWNFGRGVFNKFDSENDLSEECLRRFVEESDNLQGFQVSFDNSSFGGFTTAFLESIRDEFTKAVALTFPVLSGTDPTKIDFEDTSQRKIALQDGACLYALSELATQSIPIQSPTTWQLGEWSDGLNINKTNVFQTSAVLSSHIESATLSLRLKSRQEDLSNFCRQLNWSQSTCFSHLSGALPIGDHGTLSDRIHDFSTVVDLTKFIAQRNVTRGLNVGQVLNAEGFFSSKSGLDTPYLSNTHAPAYPLPSSYPKIFRTPPTSSSRPQVLKPVTATNTKSIALLSALSTTTATATVLRGYAALARTCVRRRVSGMDAAGLGADELSELEEALWTMGDAYAGLGGGDKESGDEEEGVGEDELDE
ncbi:hypothetical protein M0805_009381 [Coniferiporia weirii]|nr:hypothetical protein M0805_009381 [Coniferiporia weirii]